MNKHLLFLLLIVAAIWGATRLFQSPVVDSTPIVQARTSTATTQASTATPSTRSQEKSGIEISIEAVEQRGNTTVLKLTMNNHQFDLSQDEIYDNATLNGARSQSHAFLGEPSGGGHHAEVEVVFPLATEGSFTIAPTQDAVFSFDNLW
ncbi:MAG: hypothetical protein NUV84_02605 [Candidatus Uhrbacteria bacterium]|nr:hypothetical protein [Candidatus Uhrbacteria bacterium]